MAAVDHLAPRQLSMFMPAKQLYDMPSADAEQFDSVDQMRRIKRRPNNIGRLGAHVAEHGVHTPVQIAHSGGGLDDWTYGHPAVVANGNHRLIAQYDANPNAEVPVVHHDSEADAFSTLRQQDAIKWRG